MQNLKKMIGRYLSFITAAVIVFVIVMAFVVQALNAQYTARKDAEAMLIQMEQLLNRNHPEIHEMEELGDQADIAPKQVGRLTEKDELTYLFDVLKVNVGMDCFAIRADTGEVLAATMTDLVGKNVTEVGIDLRKVEEDRDGFHAKINGRTYFCVFKEVGNNWIGRVVSDELLYENIPLSVTGLALCCIFVGVIQVMAVSKYLNIYVIKGIQEVNVRLKAISNGELTEGVNVNKSVEFAELSRYINEMVKSLMSSNRKLSYVLSKTNMYIGIYEYNEHDRKVRVSEQVSNILGLDKEETAYLTSDFELFKKYIVKILKNVFDEEEKIYYLNNGINKYLRIEELYEKNEMFGVIIDVTEEVNKRLLLEEERDIDLLTGLYNRRGLENKLALLFEEPEKMGYGALVMIDADGLKEINDLYGHENGDLYLKKVGNIIKGFGINESLASRQGGDEFVLLLYDYVSVSELLKTIETLRYIQNNSTAHLSDGIDVPLRFSLGYVMLDGRKDYLELLREADEKMYADKRQRKAKLKSAIKP